MRSVRLILTGLLGLTAIPTSAATFTENFEGALGQWTGKNGGPIHGQIVADPLRPGNHVLNFFALNNGGDMYSSIIDCAVGQQAVFQFDYLGLAKPGSVPDDFGGFIGYTMSTDLSYGDIWIGGTRAGYDYATHLIDDGQWRTYTFNVDALPFAPLRMMVEDWVTAGGVAGDAYFDNISVTILPEPTAAMLLSAALLVGLPKRM